MYYSSEEETEGERLENILSKADVVLPPESLTMLANQFLLIKGWLAGGAVCLRWRLLDEDQREKVLDRLLEGMAAIIFYIVSDIGIDKKSKSLIGGHDALDKVLKGRTIILHGSYLFGPQIYTPADMDVIDTGASFGRGEAALIKLSRETKEGKMTIGKRFSPVDVMVGIPLWIEEKDMLNGKQPKQLWGEVAENVKGYLQDAKQEGNKGKRYRKLINIAVIVDYFAQTAEVSSSSLKADIEKANTLIVSGRLMNDKQQNDTNQKLQKECEQVKSGVDKKMGK